MDAPCTPQRNVLIVCLAVVGVSSWCKSDLPVTGPILKSIFLTKYKTVVLSSLQGSDVNGWLIR